MGIIFANSVKVLPLDVCISMVALNARSVLEGKIVRSTRLFSFPGFNVAVNVWSLTVASVSV